MAETYIPKTLKYALNYLKAGAMSSVYLVLAMAPIIRLGKLFQKEGDWLSCL